jgi:predicted GIY-YIG superfamily endonuclease
MFYVYLIRSIPHPDQTYIGFTQDLKRRLEAHNRGGSVHTAKFKPWELISYHAFRERKLAMDFEAYLKTGSGQAFAKRRLW